MRKNNQFKTPLHPKTYIIEITLIFFLILGCKKHDTVSNSIINKPQTNIEAKVSAYLESQKIMAGIANTSIASRNPNIDLLEENLDFSGATTEYFDNKHDFLIVPIKDKMITKKN